MAFKSIALAATTLILSTNINAALFERLGGQAYYDDVLDITWIADGNIVGNTPDGSYSGRDTWLGINDWVNNFEIAGITGWRLPTALDTGAIKESRIVFCH